MKELVNKIIFKVKNFIEFFDYKLKNSKSFLYTLVLFSVIIGYGFFFNSNAILNDSSVKYTTPLFEAKKVDNFNVELRERKYCKFTNNVEFYIYQYDSSTLYNNTLDFELKEKNNPTENIPVEIRRVDKNNYVVRAEVPKKWTVLSLGVRSFNPLEINTTTGETDSEKENDRIKNNSISSNTVKFYSEYDDMEKVNNLDMKKSEEYISEFADLEIESINKRIDEINKLIQEKSGVINAYEENINRLKEDKVYQTDTERQSTDTKISSIESIISSEKENIDKFGFEKKELLEKIRKLEEKKRNLKEKL
ncbi:hypothetical protein QRW90_16520 [Clostridioides difficile]|uniref:hypothetical protein n=1 Tax=Clostridioides difficile TaxID=1496 RepID=UPI001266B96A|nr:hypothetical protein [Clostridioides difficile]MDL5120586.1 hypothetical protein [Clostridioides difficile]QFS33385.1 hypothetical protein FTB24_19295 [Clostridioides difficile]QIF80154.1 hypothetical protein EUU24_16915 [Clostridioides difficile]